MNWIELFASCAGLLSVGFSIKRSIWCWPTGLIQVVLFIYIFYHAKLYSDVLLHIIYAGLQIYGWISWRKVVSASNQPIPISRSTPLSLSAWCTLALLGGLTWGWGMSRFTDAAAPFGNALVMSGSLVAQWLLVQRKIETWLFWIAVDLLAISVYLQQSLYFTSVLYMVFLVMCLIGWRAWGRSLSTSQEAQT
jgi:nicotinamide mononucleotide transporter